MQTGIYYSLVFAYGCFYFINILGFKCCIHDPTRFGYVIYCYSSEVLTPILRESIWDDS